MGSGFRVFVSQPTLAHHIVGLDTLLCKPLSYLCSQSHTVSVAVVTISGSLVCCDSAACEGECDASIMCSGHDRQGRGEGVGEREGEREREGGREGGGVERVSV